MAWVGLDDAHRREHDVTTFCLEAHVTYHREVRSGDPLRFTTVLLGHDAKRLHYIHAMYHATEGFLASTNELMSLHVSQATRGAAPMAGRGARAAGGDPGRARRAAASAPGWASHRLDDAAHHAAARLVSWGPRNGPAYPRPSNSDRLRAFTPAAGSGRPRRGCTETQQRAAVTLPSRSRQLRVPLAANAHRRWMRGAGTRAALLRAGAGPRRTGARTKALMPADRGTALFHFRAKGAR